MISPFVEITHQHRFSSGRKRNKCEPCTTNQKQTTLKRKKKTMRKVHSFTEARRITRCHGFTSREEFMEYNCAGSYQVPKNADILYVNEWKGWDDFLGLMLSFPEARHVARTQLRYIETKEDYLKFMENKGYKDDELTSRLPYRPDVYYKHQWTSWDDWLGLNE
mmetsp:Transcript_7699/g.11008  ORF Transcript_7699/g.11008 Transcript_7699/m.11008 type:complete len:164 (+) Transcript_7699:155-646(+)